MLQIVVTQAQYQVTDMTGAPGGKILQFRTGDGIEITIPLDEKSAKSIAAALGSGIIIASGPLQTNGKAQ